MPSIPSFLSYIFLFIGLCIFVVFAMALFNIATKSYKPRNAIVILGVLMVLFLINAFLAFSNLNRTLQASRSSEAIIQPGGNQKTDSGAIF
jgi:phosphoglycerol transferase MdoB-like AlkP superfamily enzyme